MSREARITRKNFKGKMRVTWWGYLLPSLACQDCSIEDNDCATCDGEHKVYPRCEPPAYPVGSVPSWVDPFSDRWGWQMWETTSEGSPISPVMDTPEELARWLADNRASAFGGTEATFDQWLNMITQGHAVSAVWDSSKGFRSGVEALSD